MTFAEGFWAKVDKSAGPDACWPWTAYVNTTGYGQVHVPKSERALINRRTASAPSVACAMSYGPRPDGMHVLHSCDNRLCVNPRHLRWGTQAENNKEAWARGRQQSGERHHQARYSDAEVREVIAAVQAGARPADLSQARGIPERRIYKWVAGESRKGFAA